MNAASLLSILPHSWVSVCLFVRLSLWRLCNIGTVPRESPTSHSGVEAEGSRTTLLQASLVCHKYFMRWWLVLAAQKIIIKPEGSLNSGLPEGLGDLEPTIISELLRQFDSLSGLVLNFIIYFHFGVLKIFFYSCLVHSHFIYIFLILQLTAYYIYTLSPNCYLLQKPLLLPTCQRHLASKTELLLKQY